MDITLDAIKHIEGRRPVLITLQDGSGRLLVLGVDDKSVDKYVEIERFVKQTGQVSTVESFAELVMEYADRFDKKTGKGMTVCFTSTGAIFSPDDADRRHLFDYKRVISQQWQTVVKSLGGALTHKEFVRVLQSLAPSVMDYTNTLVAFRRLVVSKDAKLVSEPTLSEKGDKGNSYEVRLATRGGTADAELPRTFDLCLPYTRGSDIKHILEIEIDLDQGEDEGLEITLLAPELPAIEDKAIFAEMKFFEDSTEKLSDLLLVVNF